MRDNNHKLQLIWGIALFIMGIAFFFRIPGVVMKLSATKGTTSTPVFIEGILYLIAILLIAGGGMKVYAFWKLQTSNKPPQPPSDGNR